MNQLKLLLDGWPWFLAVASAMGVWSAHSVSALPRRIYAEYDPQALDTLPASSKALKIGMVLGIVALWMVSGLNWGVSMTACCWAIFFSALLTLTVIDWRTLLLPDAITLPLLWWGLLASSFQWLPLPLVDAVWGAALGYVGFWAVAHIFKCVTGQEGMGAGDFKLMAALGAWLGPLALLPVALMASSLSAAGALLLIRLKQGSQDTHWPFGPCLAIGGAVMVIYGPEITAFLLG